MERIDILEPPAFKRGGRTKTVKKAIEDGDWLGVFNLWVVQTKPVPAIVYQQRTRKAHWAPGKLDASVGGHYSAGETVYRGALREVKEEIGKIYKVKDLRHSGRRLNVVIGVNGKQRKAVVEIFLVKDNSPLRSYKLDPKELEAICICPIDKLIKVHTQKGYSFRVKCLTKDGKEKELKVTKNSFPYNFDDYHFKMALLAKRFARGEKPLIY